MLDPHFNQWEWWTKNPLIFTLLYKILKFKSSLLHKPHPVYSSSDFKVANFMFHYNLHNNINNT